MQPQLTLMIRKRIFSFFLLVMAIPIFTHAQPKEERLRFVDYLVNNNFFEEAIFESNQILSSNSLSPAQKDSVYYLKGWALYNMKKLDQSTNALKNVTGNSYLYEKSHLFAAYNQIHLKKYDNAHEILDRIEPKTKVQQDFSLFLASGSLLLQRDVDSFQKKSEALPSDYYGFSTEIKNLTAIARELASRRPKSPALAGIMSGIIPGSGKIYAGKTGQGIAAFLMSTGLALVTIENFEKRGPKKFETILFGSAFTLFYVGNIYGAAFSAKIVNTEYNELTDRKILFNLHVPLRNVFD